MKVDDTVRVTYVNKRYICIIKEIRSDGFGGANADLPSQSDLFFLWAGIQKVAVLT